MVLVGKRNAARADSVRPWENHEQDSSLLEQKIRGKNHKTVDKHDD